jgi:hypothetical protein
VATDAKDETVDAEVALDVGLAQVSDNLDVLAAMIPSTYGLAHRLRSSV